jgi:peptidyl-prolyl cis-trans isomerase SurA
MTQTVWRLSSGVLGVWLALAPNALAQQAPPAAPSPAPPAATSAQPAASAPAAATLPDSSGAPKSTILERVIVRVNGEIFTQSQLTQRQIAALRDRNRDVQDQRALQDDATLRNLLAQVTPQILVQAVDELLLVQRGREIGAKFTDEQFKTAVDNLKESNKLDEASFKKALEQEGLTMEDLRAQIEKSYLIRQVQQQEIHMTITEEELRQYYAAHKDAFMTPATVTLRELFVGVPTRTQNGVEVFNPIDDAAAKSKVEDARARVLGGTDFASIVAQLSESASKPNGGLVGPVNVADLSPSLKETLDKLKVGELTEPIRTPRGYQLIKLEARGESTLQPFEEIRPQIEQRVRSDRLQGETEKLLARLHTQAVIEWKDEAFRLMYEKALAAQSTQ